VRAWRRSGLTLDEFGRQHEIGVGKLIRWKRRFEQEAESSAVALAPMVATGAAAAVVVRIGEIEIEVRAVELVAAEWVAALAEHLAAARARG